MRKLYVFDIEDNPIREATSADIAREGDERGIWTGDDGGLYFVDWHLVDTDDEWLRSWHQEIAREEGMLGGIQAFNECMGY